MIRTVLCGEDLSQDFILAADVVYFEEQDPLVDALKERETKRTMGFQWVFLAFLCIC